MEFSRQNNLVSVLIKNYDNFDSILQICNPKEALNEINLARYSNQVTNMLTSIEKEKLQYMQAKILSKGIFVFLNEPNSEQKLKNLNFINHDPLIWQINASMKHLQFKYFSQFIEESMKIISRTYTNPNHLEIFQKLKTASSSILVSFMNYACYCPAIDREAFYKLFKSKLKSFETNPFKSKIDTIMGPIDFFTKDKNSLSINFYEHVHKTPEKLEKFLDFTSFYFNCAYYPTQKIKKEANAKKQFEDAESALYVWLKDKIAHLNSEKQQAYLDLFSKNFKSSNDSAEKIICQKLSEKCDKTGSLTAPSAHDLRQQILDTYKLIEHIDFEPSVLKKQLTKNEIDNIYDFIRKNHYLGVGVGYINHGKQMPINKLIKLVYMDKDEVLAKYEHKHKKLIDSLNLNVRLEMDFKTFFILGFGYEFLEKAVISESKHDSWPFKKLQKLLSNQTQKLEKKYINNNLSLDTVKTAVRQEKKNKI